MTPTPLVAGRSAVVRATLHGLLSLTLACPGTDALSGDASTGDLSHSTMAESGTPTGPTPDGGALAVTSGSAGASGAELPREYVDTRFIPPTGRTHQPTSAAALKAALKDAQPGDEIVLQAGVTYSGYFTLPAKTGASAAKWITIRSSGGLPPEGTRVTPAQGGAMAKISSPNTIPAVTVASRAAYYRLVGIEVTASSKLKLSYGLIVLGSSSSQKTAADLPHHIVLDRVYAHGHPSLSLKRCVAMNGVHMAVIDSYLGECHGKGFDSQAILGWNGPGPFKIVNNRLEGAGENVMFGGAVPSIPGVVPSDVEMRRNHFVKPLTWKGKWSAKNLLELKTGQRMLIEGNVFENSWPDGQTGNAFVWKSAGEGGRCKQCVVQDITFRNNIVHNIASVFSITDRTEGAVLPMKRISIHNNVFTQITGGSTGRAFKISGGVNQLEITHNTAFPTNYAVFLYNDGKPRAQGFVYSNNISSYATYGIAGNGGSGYATLQKRYSSFSVENNLFIGGASAAKTYPPSTMFAGSQGAVGFVNAGGPNYGLASSSPYKGRASNGGDPGAALAALENATAGVR